MKISKLHLTLSAVALTMTANSTTANAQSKGVKDKNLAPASKFDLSHWNITLPNDENKDGKVDSISVKDLQKYSHPNFFFLDNQNRMVFTAPNKGLTTKNTSNTRSELRYMLRGKNTKIKTHNAANNFALDVFATEAKKRSIKFGSIGGKMDATLNVNHVALNAGNPNKKAAYSAVVGQIHATKYDSTKSGFGYGNEPLKIYYKKWPGHNTGSVFWNYERNLAKKDENRKDITYPVWGYTWENPADPGINGVALGEDFSYTVNVHKNTMHLTFTSPTKTTVTYSINLANNVDAYGRVDPLDNKYSYAGDSLYFKAGVYNQCSSQKGQKKDSSPWVTACSGTGDWEKDRANGDYAQATFSNLVVGPSTAP